jgi:hypothetical protein
MATLLDRPTEDDYARMRGALSALDDVIDAFCRERSYAEKREGVGILPRRVLEQREGGVYRVLEIMPTVLPEGRLHDALDDSVPFTFGGASAFDDGRQRRSFGVVFFPRRAYGRVRVELPRLLRAGAVTLSAWDRAFLEKYGDSAVID